MKPNDESIQGGQLPSMGMESGVGLAPLPFLENEPMHEPIPADPPEEPMVVEELEMPISGQILLWMAVGLLAMGGVVGVEEAREMANIKPLSTAEHAELLAVAKWMKDTGCVGLPPALYRFLYRALK